MATPDFVLELRRHIGTAPLWLPGTTAVVTDADRSRVLLVKRADNGWWTPITGIVDPGESPAAAAVREAQEEADVRIRVDRLAEVSVSDPVTYANGDRATYLDHTFACTHLSGDPSPADGENTEARWWQLDALPDMPAHMRARIDVALTDEERARF